jgi:anti-anti-sigma factor
MSVTFNEEILDNGVRKILLAGTLDAPNAMSIEDEFKAALLDRGGKVIVDLSGVEYMSSYGLRMLLIGAKSLHSAGGAMHLAAPNEHVMKVITVTGYAQMFPVHETLEQALLSVNT